MDINEALRELQKHQGKWTTVKDRKILLAESRQGLAEKADGAMLKQIPRMYSGYPAWKAETEEMLKEMINSDAVKKHEEAPFIEETEDEVVMPLETEDIREKPRKSLLERILRI